MLQMTREKVIRKKKSIFFCDHKNKNIVAFYQLKKLVFIYLMSAGMPNVFLKFPSGFKKYTFLGLFLV